MIYIKTVIFPFMADILLLLVLVTLYIIAACLLIMLCYFFISMLIEFIKTHIPKKNSKTKKSEDKNA